MSWNRRGNGNKYNAHRVKFNGMSFDSQKEADRWFVLKLMERRGEICNLRAHVTFVLIPKQREVIDGEVVCEEELKYIADFVYEKNGRTVAEDVKGYRNPSDAAYRLFIAKRKMMLRYYKIKVKEI